MMYCKHPDVHQDASHLMELVSRGIDPSPGRFGLCFSFRLFRLELGFRNFSFLLDVGLVDLGLLPGLPFVTISSVVNRVFPLLDSVDGGVFIGIDIRLALITTREEKERDGEQEDRAFFQ